MPIIFQDAFDTLANWTVSATTGTFSIVVDPTDAGNNVAKSVGWLAGVLAIKTIDPVITIEEGQTIEIRQYRADTGHHASFFISDADFFTVNNNYANIEVSPGGMAEAFDNGGAMQNSSPVAASEDAWHTLKFTVGAAGVITASFDDVVIGNTNTSGNWTGRECRVVCWHRTGNSFFWLWDDLLITGPEHVAASAASSGRKLLAQGII